MLRASKTYSGAVGAIRSTSRNSSRLVDPGSPPHLKRCRDAVLSRGSAGRHGNRRARRHCSRGTCASHSACRRLCIARRQSAPHPRHLGCGADLLSSTGTSCGSVTSSVGRCFPTSSCRATGALIHLELARSLECRYPKRLGEIARHWSAASDAPRYSPRPVRAGRQAFQESHGRGRGALCAGARAVGRRRRRRHVVRGRSPDPRLRGGRGGGTRPGMRTVPSSLRWVRSAS